MRYKIQGNIRNQNVQLNPYIQDNSPSIAHPLFSFIKPLFKI